VARNLSAFFAPRSVAIVGAGERPTSSGGAVLQNLRIARYGGEVIPVNPKGGTMFGLPVRRALHELDAPADLVVIVIRPDLINAAVREAAASGHRNLLILPGGFAEAGAEGAARDAELRVIVAEHDLTVAGPNCAGIIHLPDGARFAATFLRDLPPGPGQGSATKPSGGVAFISQSGAIAEEVIAAANRTRLPIGTVATVGNAMQLGIADFLEHAGADAATMAVLLYIESLDDPERFRAIARRIAATKPVIALIGGRTAPGARAAAAHTGAVANDDAAIDEFCRDCGVLRVKTLRRLMLAGKGFAAFPAGIGRRILVLSNSGGPSVLCTDQAAEEGLDIVALPRRMAETLRAALPGETSVANPLDLLADAREDRFGLTFEAAIREGRAAFDAIIGIHVVPFMVEAGPVVDRIAALAPGAGLPVMHSMMGTLPGKEAWFATLEAVGVPCFDDAETMAECAGLLARYPDSRARAQTSAEGPVALRGRGNGGNG
jgi:acyl-CoA synthetase (NDP forming)